MVGLNGPPQFRRERGGFPWTVAIPHWLGGGSPTYLGVQGQEAGVAVPVPPLLEGPMPDVRGNPEEGVGWVDGMGDSASA